MNTTYLLLLCISAVIPATLSQEMTCTPQEVPDSVINCASLDSVFLTCACDTYKSSILELMGSLTCFIPGIENLWNVPAENPDPVSPVAPTNVTSTTMYTTVQMEPRVTMYTSSETQGLASSFGSVFNEGLLAAVKNISSQIGENSFDTLCEGIPALQQCVASGYKESTKPLDVLLRKFVNLDNLGQSLTSVCNLKAEIVDKLDCMTEAFLPMFACVSLSLTGRSSQGSPPDMMSAELDTYYCPIVGDIARCMVIQTKSCSSQLGTTLQNIVPDLLTPSCGQLAARGTNEPVMSTPVMCALQTIPRAFSVIEAFGVADPTAAQIESLTDTMIDVYCGELSDILMCIYQEIPSSMNSMDMFIKALVDVDQFAYGDTIAQYICKASRVQDMKATMPCLMTKANDIGVCLRSQRGLSFNFSTIGVDAARDRMTYCGPIANFTSCAIDSVLSKCDAGVAAYTRDIYLSLLRTDCNGVRNGDLQSLIEAQRQDTTTPINAATILTNHSLPSVVTILVLMFFYVLKFM